MEKSLLKISLIIKEANQIKNRHKILKHSQKVQNIKKFNKHHRSYAFNSYMIIANFVYDCEKINFFIKWKLIIFFHEFRSSYIFINILKYINKASFCYFKNRVKKLQRGEKEYGKKRY